MRKLTHSKYSSNDRLLIVNIREKKLQSREITDCSFFQHTILFSAYETTESAYNTISTAIARKGGELTAEEKNQLIALLIGKDGNV